jgi:phosphoketolase
MRAIDESFLEIVEANPHLRPRVGNPDEMRSNRLQKTLDALKFRVTGPEPGLPEALDGAVITVLNEEAVASAALANKGGINLIATYEAFGTKMHGVVRQEITWAASAKRAGHPPGWLSVPLILTSHTWENAKNERSHQDPSMAEVLLGEPSDISRVLFIPDANTAARTIRGVFETQGQIWTLVIPKSDTIPDFFDAAASDRLLTDGAMTLEAFSDDPPQVILTAIGAFQLEQIVKAAQRLRQRGVRTRVVYMLEPGRYREPRSDGEREHCAPATIREQLYPDSIPVRVFLCHTRPETMLGVLKPLHTGSPTKGIGFFNEGGTLNTSGMLFVNRSSWAHVVETTAALLEIRATDLLTSEELQALHGDLSPEGVIV